MVRGKRIIARLGILVMGVTLLCLRCKGPGLLNEEYMRIFGIEIALFDELCPGYGAWRQVLLLRKFMTLDERRRRNASERQLWRH